MVADETLKDGARGRGFWLDAATALVALVGVIDAAYLTNEHLAGRSVRCMIVSGCDEVLSSSYATFAGSIPVASVGALAYFTAFSLATLAIFGYDSARKFLAPLVALMFLATLWFVYLQAFVIKAYCAYCLLSAATTTTLMLLVLGRKLFNSNKRLA